MPISQSSRDPSSPHAPEGASPLTAALPTPAPAAKTGGHDHDPHEHGHHGHHGHHGDGHAAPPAAGAHGNHGSDVGSGADGGTQGTVYVCPMHPEVTSTAPGALCPKCNMKLEPKK